MPTNAYTQWQYLTPMGVGVNGSVPQEPAGGNPPATIWFRDSLDAMRSGRSDLTTGYPDGYLSTIRSRREDAPLDQFEVRQAERGYQRGVHKGERIDPADYHWPAQLRLDAGIRRQMRAAEKGEPEPRFRPLYPIIPSMSPKSMAMAGVDSGIGIASETLRRLAPRAR